MKVYRHPQGATATVYDDGTLKAVDKHGKAKKTSATAEKLAAGHGGWVLVEDSGVEIAIPVVAPGGFAARKPMKFQQAEWSLVEATLGNDDWWYQQKVDGVRAQLIMSKLGVAVRSGSGEPLKSTVAGPVAQRIMAKLGAPATSRGRDSETYVLDGEILNRKWWMFDLTTDEAQAIIPYEERLRILEEFVTGLKVEAPDLELLPTARTFEEKTALVSRVLLEGSEGIIMKRVDAGYTYDARVDHSLKWKATHTVDCVVTARNVKADSNAHLGLWNPSTNQLVQVGRTSMIGKPDAQVGDVLEVRYLYAGAGGRLVQPTVMRLREDKPERECTTDQLVFVNKEVLV